MSLEIDLGPAATAFRDELRSWLAENRPTDLEAPPLPGTAFLVEAVEATPLPEPPLPLPGFRERVVWAVELFDRLDRLDSRTPVPVR